MQWIKCKCKVTSEAMSVVKEYFTETAESLHLKPIHITIVVHTTKQLVVFDAEFGFTMHLGLNLDRQLHSS